MMAAKKRIRKHDLKEDHFVTATFQLTSYIRERQNTFLAILGGVVVVAILVMVVSSSRSRTQEEVTRLLGTANIHYQTGNLQEAIQQYQTILDQYGRSQGAAMAAFFLAESYFRQGEYEQALDAYRTYVDRYHHDELMTATSLTGIAACYEDMGQFADAGDSYSRAVLEYPEFFAAPDALLNAGRCFTTSGDVEKAIQAYQKLIDHYPHSPHAKDATMYLSELKASLK